MQVHNMKLMSKYFECIKNGTKKIELRLNDEKRKGIKIGDEIIFKELTDNPRYQKVKVINLYYDVNFSNLIDRFDIKMLSDNTTTKEELLTILNQIYSKEEQDKYGTVAIEIELIK